MAVTRTATTPNPGALKVSPGAGEFLHFIMDAGGPIPIFSFASNIKGALYEASDFSGHPMTKYEWDHLKNPSDIQQLEMLDVGLSFLTNASYTYTVQLWNAAGLVSNVIEASYAGAPTDFTTESFRVVIA